MADYKKLLLRIASLKQRYVNNTSLLAIEKKMLNLPIGSGKNLATAIYNIESANKKIDSSLKVWGQIYLTKIECIKGNSIKKLTAKNPKCLKGYKLKV
jgi:endoglucanase Acf2